MKNAMFILMVLICAGCVSRFVSDDKTSELSGQPSWFPLGGEVYHANKRFDAQKGILRFKSEPRWFLGFPKEVTKDELEAWKKKQNALMDIQFPKEHGYQVPSSPPYPKSVEDILRQNQGAALQLHIENADAPGQLIITLTLAAGERVVRREVEHRWTNVLPFLFAFFADGKAVSHKLASFGKGGGANMLVDLVPPRTQKGWRLRVATESIDALVAPEVQELAIVAAFSERQHEGFFAEELARALQVWDMKNLKPQITVRSNVIRIRRADRGWVVSGHR